MQVLATILRPFDSQKQRPSLSKNGKYILRLQFNGCYRKVTIDDRLPASSSTRSLHVVDRNSPALLWPALVEKAYLKVRGGYDFPGSNSGTDLWIMTGWIPEQIFLQRYIHILHEFSDANLIDCQVTRFSLNYCGSVSISRSSLAML